MSSVIRSGTAGSSRAAARGSRTRSSTTVAASAQAAVSRKTRANGPAVVASPASAVNRPIPTTAPTWNPVCLQGGGQADVALVDRGALRRQQRRGQVAGGVPAEGDGDRDDEQGRRPGADRHRGEHERQRGAGREDHAALAETHADAARGGRGEQDRQRPRDGEQRGHRRGQAQHSLQEQRGDDVVAHVRGAHQDAGTGDDPDVVGAEHAQRQQWRGRAPLDADEQPDGDGGDHQAGDRHRRHPPDGQPVDTEGQCEGRDGERQRSRHVQRGARPLAGVARRDQQREHQGDANRGPPGRRRSPASRPRRPAARRRRRR